MRSGVDGRWTVTVYGNPATKGSMKCIGPSGGGVRHQLIEDDKGGTRKQWRRAVEDAARAILTKRGAPFDGPVGIQLKFWLPRPASVTRPRPHTRGTGDVDKLTRLILDAITNARLWADDAQACRTVAVKAYADDGHRPGVEITLWAIRDDVTTHHQDPLIRIGGTP